MKRILLFIMAITFSLAPFAQKHSAQKKPVRKTAVTAKKKAATPARKPNSRSHVARKTSKPAAPTRAERKAATYSMPLSEVCRDSALLSERRSESRSRLCREIRRM